MIKWNGNLSSVVKLINSSEMLIKTEFFFPGGGRRVGVVGCYIYRDRVYFCIHVSYIRLVNIATVYFAYRKKISFNK